MPDVDVSSYPKPALPVNPLDMASKIGSLQQQQQSIQSNALTIDKQKLDLVNQRFGEMAKGFAGLINDPNLSEDDVRQYTQNQVKLGYITPDMAATFIGTLPPQQSFGGNQAAYQTALKQTLQTHMQHAQSIVDAVNFHYGQPGTVDTGKAIQPVVTSPKFGIQSTGQPIAKQLPVGTPIYGDTGQPMAATAQPDQPPSGMVNAPPPRPNALPVGPVTSPAVQGQSSNFGGNVTGATVEPPQSFDNRFGAALGPTPMFEEGKKQLAADQDLAATRMTAIKPALQALPLLQGLRTGPGTQQWNNAIAFLKANNVISTDQANDPTAVYQEVSKKLAQYVGGSPLANRSDAGQTLAEASSPNPKTQINPALVKLTRDAITLDRVQAARPAAFKDTNLANYGNFRATFPQSIDERAFGLDLLPQDESKGLVDKMAAQLNSKNTKSQAEANKFFKSLRIAKDQGFYQ